MYLNILKYFNDNVECHSEMIYREHKRGFTSGT